MLRMHIYDLVRQPRMPSLETDEVAVIVPLTLKTELTCPICLDTLKETVRSKVCLHRFCRECIGRALRTGNSECPCCRSKLPCKRYLTPDPTYDAVIRVILASQQAAAEMDASEAETSRPTNSRTLAATTLPPTERPEDQVLIHLLPHPQMPLSKFPANVSQILASRHLVRTSAEDCTVAHIAKYLRMRATVELLTKADEATSRNAEQFVQQNIQDIIIFARAEQELISLSMFDFMNLLSVFSKFRRCGLIFPLQFYYYYQGVAISGCNRPPSPLKITGLSRT
ncbi:hypothetical protein M514_00675 [Trichuris suis]|nr:hypothetical protein M514_00675 [Trichuris suis]KHJ42855.1 zinc finger, C3HC4 type [Trichuris suis]